VLHALQHLVVGNKQVCNNLVYRICGWDVVSGEYFVKWIKGSDCDQSPLLIWPVLLCCLNTGVQLVLVSELQQFADQHVHRGGSRAVPNLHGFLMGHPHALIVYVQQVLLVDELRGQLGEDAAIPLQDLVQILLVADEYSGLLLRCLWLRLR
jgi:hypothetical protein